MEVNLLMKNNLFKVIIIASSLITILGIILCSEFGLKIMGFGIIVIGITILYKINH